MERGDVVNLHQEHGGRGESQALKLAHSFDFEKHHKAYYNEGKFFQTQENLPLGNNKNSNGGGISMGSGDQSVILDIEPRPVEKGWTGGLVKGVRDETDLMTHSRSQESLPRSQGLAMVRPQGLNGIVDQSLFHHCLSSWGGGALIAPGLCCLRGK